MREVLGKSGNLFLNFSQFHCVAEFHWVKMSKVADSAVLMPKFVWNLIRRLIFLLAEFVFIERRYVPGLL